MLNNEHNMKSPIKSTINKKNGTLTKYEIVIVCK